VPRLDRGMEIFMNNIDVANGIIFQKLKISKDSFDDRLICQKKIYLLQSLGTDLGYSYNWYVRGPYSPILTNYVYNNLDLLSSSNFEGYTLSETAERNVSIVNSLIDSKKADLGEVFWYELLASLLYIIKNKKSWNVDDNDLSSLFSTLIRFKPQYNKEQCEYALSVLKDKGFVELGA